MSVEEEVEIGDMIAQTLELNGCLPRIRAELRANLFLELNEHLKINKQQSMLNPKIKTYLETPEGQLMFCLVREFLEYFDLDFTTSVYDSESYVGNVHEYEGRQKIIENFGLGALEDVVSGPLLLHVIKIAQMKSKTLKINLKNITNNQEKESNSCSVPCLIQEQINGHSFLEDEKSVRSEGINVPEDGVDNNPMHATFVKRDTESDDTFNGTSSIEEEIPYEIDSNVSKKLEDEWVTTSQEQDIGLESKSRSKSEKLKTRLDHPTLQLNKTRGNHLLPSLYKKSTKEFDFEIKDDYEEDFMSGSELELSQSKTDSSKPPFDQLHQSECPVNSTSSTSNLKSLKKFNSCVDNRVNCNTIDIDNSDI